MTAAAFETYDDWKIAALAADKRSGADNWKNQDATDLFDYRVIRNRLHELHEIRKLDDPHELYFYLLEGVHGNMGGMGSPKLYSRAKFGTKKLITDYVSEITSALRYLETVPDTEISLKEKINFYRRSAECFGRSALMLSGAGSLGPFHVGVVKALAEQRLLPNVISGASAGSLVAAVACTHTQAELDGFLSSDVAAAIMQANPESAPAKAGGQISQQHLRDMVSGVVPDLTFAEAYEATGRYLNVSVTAAELHQRSRLLNVSTSPNVYIHEAVMASCAIPGVFQPVTLMAKSASGERRPYVASRKWIDGSISDDLPARRLARLYGVNHFISSQTNPMVLWALQDPDSADTLCSRMASVGQSTMRDWSRAVYPFALEAVRNIYPANVMTRMMFSLLTQQYTADINIMPTRRVVDPAQLMSVLTTKQSKALIQDGERSTWPKLEMIRNCTEISRCIDETLLRLEDSLVS